MFTIKLILSVLLNVVIFGTALFVPAQTLHWWRAWVFLAVVFVACSGTMFLVIAPGNEALMNERLKPPIQKAQPAADKVLTILLIVSFFALIIFMPLDVFRFHLLAGPGLALSILGLVLFASGWTIMSLSFRENAFAAPVVKYQGERHQRVIDSGVYGVVRHPMYAGTIPLLLGMSLWLESYAAALLAIIPIGILALRIGVEEKLLHEELTGYDGYVARVPYRLIPFVW